MALMVSGWFKATSIVSEKKNKTAIGTNKMVAIIRPLLKATPHARFWLLPKDWLTKVSSVPLKPKPTDKANTLMSMLPVPTPATTSALSF